MEEEEEENQGKENTEDLIENDQVSPEEEAFIRGYEEDGEETKEEE